MKSFVLKFSLFVFCLLGFVALMFLANRFVLKSGIGPFQIEPNKNVLALGNSQINRSINEEYLPNFKNYAHGGDPYFYSYVKLKELIALNQGIDTVFVGFNSRNISQIIDENWFLNEEQLNEKLKLYVPLLSYEELRYLYEVKPKSTLRAVASQSLILAQLIFAGKKTYGDGSSFRGKNTLEAAKKGFLEGKENDETKSNRLQVSEHEVYFLNKIVKLCEEENISLILINPPVHPLLNETSRSVRSQFYAYYFNYYSSIPFLDYSEVLWADENFDDLVHMSKVGSERFSRRLKKDLANQELLVKE